MTRRAACACGQLSATIEGEPVRVSVCHCHDCQRRSGSAFAAQARFPRAAITLVGAWRTWEKRGGSGNTATFHWCPACGGTLGFTGGGFDDQFAVPLGAFDPGEAPLPRISLFESRMQPWVRIVGDAIERWE